MNKRSSIIITSGLIGAAVGSSAGIAYGGDAIAGTLPVAFLFAYLAYVFTLRPTNNDTTVLDSHLEEIKNTIESAKPKILTSADKASPVLYQFFSAVWNLAINVLQALGLMPVIKRYPWLLALMIFLFLGLVPPVGIVLLIAAGYAVNYGANADNNFLLRRITKVEETGSNNLSSN